MSASTRQVDGLVDNLFRKEAGKMTAVLTRLLGFQSLTVAEDLVQETLMRALSVWKIKGIPDNPEAWLYTVARRLAIDTARKRTSDNKHQEQFSARTTSEWSLATDAQTFFLEHEIQDSQLRLMFVCCHPEIPTESQVALILKTLCGLSTREIAAGFLTQEETIQKRLVRARHKLQEVKPSTDTPAPVHLRERLDTVLLALYLLFNEGYHSHGDQSLIRPDICGEAIRLGHLLIHTALTDIPDARALLALMYFQASRFPARLSADNNPILLKEQDRRLWDRQLIEAGEALLNSSATGNRLSAYHLEAAISSLHAHAPSFELTDWRTITEMYDCLIAHAPSDSVRLNRAIAYGYSTSPEIGIQALEELRRALEDNAYFLSALGDFHLATGSREVAGSCYAQALVCARTPNERHVIGNKIQSLTQAHP